MTPTHSSGAPVLLDIQLWAETVTPRLAGTEALQRQCGKDMGLEDSDTGNLLRFQWGAGVPQ